MKKPIIEIEELGEPNSLIYRKDAQISEIVNTEKLIEELNEQLRLHFVVGQNEQCCEHAVTEQKTLRCTCCEECGEILDVLD